jgi:8-amino-7-oxononanoate synthase
LKWQLRQDAACQLRPIVVTDGFCPSCGKIAPITEYLELIRTLNGYLIIDDTQAIGILGYKPGHQAPYGKGGGGSLRWSNTGGNDVIVISSMAKGFGVPMAVLAGSSYTVQQFEEKSETLVHCSPPSIAVVHAAKHALELNHQYGDKLRLRLAQLVNYFRQRLKRFNLYTRGGLFPVQTLVPIPGLDVRILHRRLTSMGVRTVLRRNCNGHSAHISFLITARHNMHDIDRAVDRVVEAIDNENVNSIKKKVNYEVSI